MPSIRRPSGSFSGPDDRFIAGGATIGCERFRKRPTAGSLNSVEPRSTLGFSVRDLVLHFFQTLVQITQAVNLFRNLDVGVDPMLHMPTLEGVASRRP